jgi:hypothetical protein
MRRFDQPPCEKAVVQSTALSNGGCTNRLCLWRLMVAPLWPRHQCCL